MKSFTFSNALKTCFVLSLALLLGAFTKAQNTVVDVVVNSPDHETLEAAVIAAELNDDLAGEGPFTVFAPTDAAFGALPPGTVDALLQDPTGELANILLHHVVGAKALSTDLSDDQDLTTLLGSEVEVTINAEGVFIDNAKVTVADIEADNGVVHVINAVLLPEYDVMVKETAEFGVILTDDDGETLYFFTKDADGTSACTGGCLDNWPIFYDDDLLLPAALNADDFGSIDRGHGVMQTTYKGWPLYYYANDHAAGDVTGDGAGGVWFVAKPDYTIMLVDNQLVGADGNNYNSNYEPGDEEVQYFVDGSGNTLYTWINDTKLNNRFTAPDFSNNGVWPIYEQEDVVLPSTLNSADFAVIDVYGKPQLTYKGWPLYFFGQDMQRGETKGVSVPSPGVWPVGVASMMEAPTKTVMDIIAQSEDHTQLEAAILVAGLDDDLSAEGPFTVFAPTDEAIANLPDGVLEDVLTDPEGKLTTLLLYHVVEGNTLSTDLSDGQVIKTMLGKDVVVTINQDGVFINDAQVTVADIEGDNGTVHVIDAVLLPPTTVVDIIVGSDIHNTLEAAVVAADLVDALNSNGPFTVFAPTDAAFELLPEDALDALLADPTGELTDILLYHVVQAKALSTDLSDGQVITTMLGKDVTVTINAEGVFINDAEVTLADLEADNGVVHVIDAVLTPPEVTVVDIIVNSTDHNTLETAVIAAGLADDLSGEGPFTVFAPTDAAFDLLPDGALQALLDDPTGDLAETLLYHVVQAKALSTDLNDGDVLNTMLAGENVSVTISSEGIFINDAQVIVADLVADNGVVHVINAVLLPGTTSVGEIDADDASSIALYPNPASANVNIEFVLSASQNVNIEIFSISGQKVAERKLGLLPAGASTISQSVSNLSNGMYFIIVRAGNATLSSKLKVVK